MSKNLILQALRKATGLKQISLERPKEPDHGDYAFPCFTLAKTLKKSPTAIAEDLKGQFQEVSLEGVERIETIGPYLNFFLDPAKNAQAVLSTIQAEGDAYGTHESKNRTMLLEYFHANTHKGVHIGHIRNISLGEALARIYEKTGNTVIRTNYQGDIGPHVTKCLYGFLHGDQNDVPSERRGVWLGKIYAETNKTITGNPALEQEIRTMTKQLYDGDKELQDAWKKTRTWCLEDFEQMYKDFHVQYDRLYFESEVEQEGKRIVKEMLEKGIAQKSEGAVIMDLKEDGLGVYVLLRDDGVALYHTKDLALAELKAKEFGDVDRSIHVVGKEQELYFKQLFRTFELIGSPMADKSYHLIYELVMLPEGKMSSREGNVVWYDDLIDKLRELARDEVSRRHEDWKKDRIDKTANMIAFGALKFAMINRDNLKVLVFDWEKALDFEGETGPYVQYSYARIRSILRKHGKPLREQVDYTLLKEPLERRIVNHLEDFPSALSQAASSKKPIVVSRYLLDLAQLWNAYYHAHQVLQGKESLQDARLHLVDAIRQVFEIGMGLLAIDLPEQM